MNFNTIDTNTLSADAGELDQLAALLNTESQITTEKVVIDTPDGNRLVIESDAGYGEVTIKNKP